jgi:hypothetical protein
MLLFRLESTLCVCFSTIRIINFLFFRELWSPLPIYLLHDDVSVVLLEDFLSNVNSVDIIWKTESSNSKCVAHVNPEHLLLHCAVRTLNPTLELNISIELFISQTIFTVTKVDETCPDSWEEHIFNDALCYQRLAFLSLLCLSLAHFRLLPPATCENEKVYSDYK